MDSKLAALIDRLEAVVARAEAGGAAPVQAALATAKAAASGPVNPLVRDWQNDVMSAAKAWTESATALNIKQVSVVTEQFNQLINLQMAVYLTMSKFAQPADFSFLCAKMNEFSAAAALVKQKDFKSPPNHMQTVIDGMQMFTFVGYQEAAVLKEVVKDFHDQVSFYGNKVLKMEKDLDTKWYNCFKDLCGAFLQFMLKHSSNVAVWRGKEDAAGAEAYFNSIADACMKGEAPSSGAPAQAAPAQAAPTQAAPAQAVATGPKTLAQMYKDDVMCTMKALKDASDAMGVAQISTAMSHFLELIDEQHLIFALQAKFKKPSNSMILTKKKMSHYTTILAIKEKDFKAPVNHIGLIHDALNLFGSSALTNDDVSKEYIKESYEMLAGPGNKILRMDKEKDTKWVEAFMATCKVHFTFVLANFSKIHEWSGAEADFSGAFEKGVVAAEPVKVAEAPKAETPKVVAAPVKKAPVKRAPTKVYRNKMWQFENYNGEDLTLDTAEYVDKSFVLNFFSCQNMTIKVVGKIKGVVMEGCKKVTLIVDTVVSDVNVMNCGQMKVFGLGEMKSLTVETTNELNLQLNSKNTGIKIATTCTRSIWVRWPKDGADETDNDDVNWHRMPIAETYETEVVGKEIVTKPMESLE